MTLATVFWIGAACCIIASVALLRVGRQRKILPYPDATFRRELAELKRLIEP